MANYDENPTPGLRLSWVGNTRKCKCRGCEGAIPNGAIKLQIHAGYRIGYIYMCEACFLSAQQDYEDG